MTKIKNSDITSNHIISGKGLRFDLKKSLKHVINKFPILRDITSNQESELTKFVKLQQFKLTKLYKSLKKNKENFFDDTQVKKFLNAEIKVSKSENV